MIDQITKGLDFQSQALLLRAERQKLLAANIANADTPNYKAVDFEFGAALREASARQSSLGGTDAGSNLRNVGFSMKTLQTGPIPQYRVPPQFAIDRNTVDMDMERMQFSDNAVRYEATLRFLTGQVRTLLSAIRGDQA